MPRDPLLSGYGQSNFNMGGFGIYNANFVGNVQSSTIYVDPAMVDDLTGARGTGAPFQTIEAAVEVAEPGDTIVLSPGIHAYDGVIDLFQLPGLRLVGYGAIIQSLVEANEIIKVQVRSSHVTIEGIEFNGAVTGTPDITGTGCIVVTSTFCTIRNCYFHDQTGAGINLSGNTGRAIINDNVFRACLHAVRSEAEEEAVADTESISISRNKILQSRHQGIIIGGPELTNEFFYTGVQIENNQFFGNDALNADVAALTILANVRGIQINNNTFENESNGIYLESSKDTGISGNFFKGISQVGIWLYGCYGIRVNDNLHDSRNDAGAPVTNAPLLIQGYSLAPNDAGNFVITGNQFIAPQTNSDTISVANASGVLINSNRIEGKILLYATSSIVLNDNQFSVPQTTYAVLIDAGNRTVSKISIVGNRFNFVGASINACIATTDASGNAIDDVLIEANATPVGLTYDVATYGHIGPNLATNVIQIGNVPPSTTGDAADGWLNEDSGLVTAIDTLYVSQAFGNNSTGTRNSKTARFLTINAAITAAQADDTVIVEDGVFNERINAKSAITVRFMPSATLVCSTSSGCIRSTATGQIFTVYHEHDAIQNSENNTPCVSWTHTTGVLTLYADLYNSGTGNSSRAVLAQDGIVELWGSARSLNADGITLQTGVPSVKVHGRYLANDVLGGNSAVTVSSGQFTATNAGLFSSESTALAIANVAGLVTLKQCTLQCAGGGAGSTSPAIAITSGAVVPTLRDCVLVAGPTANHSILINSGSQTIRLYGQTVANKGSDPPSNVTFTGGGTYDVNSGVVLEV